MPACFEWLLWMLLLLTASCLPSWIGERKPSLGIVCSLLVGLALLGLSAHHTTLKQGGFPSVEHKQ